MKNLTLHQQRKRLNQIFDNIINSRNVSEFQFDTAMAAWIKANKKLEEKEENYDVFQNTTVNYATFNTVQSY